MVLRIDEAPFLRQILIVYLFRLIDHDVASSVRKTKRNTQQLLQAHPQRLSFLWGHEKEHEATTSRAQQLATQCAGAEAGLVYFVDVGRRDFPCQCSFDLPTLVQQPPKLS